MTESIFKDDIEIITPLEETLIEIINPEDTICPKEGCDKIFRNSSALRLHVVKTHGDRSITKENNGKTKMYACPVKGCQRNAKSPRQNFFSILYRLKRVSTIL